MSKSIKLTNDIYLDPISIKPISIVTDGEPVKLGYKIDNKDVYFARRSYATKSNITQNSASLDVSNLNISQIIEITGTYDGGLVLGDYQAVTYTTTAIVIWFNNASSRAFNGYLNIIYTK